MNLRDVFLSATLFYPLLAGTGIATEFKNNSSIGTDSKLDRQVPICRPGLAATYLIESSDAIPDSVVKSFSLIFGPLEESRGRIYQWIRLLANKANGEFFNVWILSDRYPPADIASACKATARYIYQGGATEALEFRHQFSGEAVLPSLGGWNYLWPHTDDGVFSDGRFAMNTNYLGHSYILQKLDSSANHVLPEDIRILELLPDVLIGVPSNTKQKDQTRRYDDSDYELIRLTKSDYDEMIEAGMNCLRVDKEQAGCIDRRNVFYWGVSTWQISYPECLYRSNYLGPVLFLDEPAVCTRDHVIRPRLRDDKDFRKSITPQRALEEFKQYFHKAKYQGSPTGLLSGLEARPDIDTGSMEFMQQNLYTWETMVSSALYQLGEGKNSPPCAMVFEPPGRIGTRRTLPEMNMAYLCQIPVDDPKNFIDIIYGFLRGAARYTNKGWGTSIYGQVDSADAPWFLTHAYDLGAQYFFFWDSYRLACVPYNECLALAKKLREHALAHPDRNLQGLKQAAEVAILLPAGYNLGHVYMGKGNLWGLGELNLERNNQAGVKYRAVMGNFFTEIERYIRMGVAYDLLWDIDGYSITGYREIVRIREDGKVEVATDDKTTLYEGPRIPNRPEGVPPQLDVELSMQNNKAPVQITACAFIIKGSADIYYTLGANAMGIYKNAMVLWELYGPGEEDYRFLSGEHREPDIVEEGGRTKVEIQFTIKQHGQYRLRAAVVDLAGRTCVVWRDITVEN